MDDKWKYTNFICLVVSIVKKFSFFCKICGIHNHLCPRWYGRKKNEQY